jgi:hypothetical protein
VLVRAHVRAQRVIRRVRRYAPDARNVHALRV